MPRRTAVIVAAVAVLAVVFGAAPGTSFSTDCVEDDPVDIRWHFETYGAGCDAGDETYISYPEGEQIDLVGEPPWVPLST